MPAKPTTAREYLAALPAERRRIIEAIRKVIRANIDKDFKEGIQYGGLAWFLPHSKYPDGYHCDPSQPLPFAGIASQKQYVSLHMFCIYGNGDEEARFRTEWLATGARLDMGKSCVRIKKLEDVPLEVIGRAFKRVTAKKFVAHYESAVRDRGTRKAAAKKAATNKKTVVKKATAKKATAKKATAKKATAKKATAKKATAKKKVVRAAGSA